MTSVPIYRLKRKARLLARANGIPLHAALDRVAMEEGQRAWSLLAARHPARISAAEVFASLTAGDLVLVGARPGHGKTRFSLELAIEATRSGAHSVFFTLEYTERECLKLMETISARPSRSAELLELDCSDLIDAGDIAGRLASAPRGTLAVIDYLQLLDQKRDSPPLAAQLEILSGLTWKRGLIVVCLSQIHRSYDPSTKSCPDIRDVRLPSPVNLSIFNKTCFMNDSEIRFQVSG